VPCGRTRSGDVLQCADWRPRVTLLLLTCALLGVIAGLLAGLLGVGGGLVIVPALVWAFLAAGFAEESLIHMAVGTSLATIVLTAVSSVMAHHRRGAVRWGFVARLTPGVVVGVLAGAGLADHLDAVSLRRVFGTLEILIAGYMALGVPPPTSVASPRLVTAGAAGTAIGLISGLAGIGGGTMTVPLLVHWGVRLQEAIATSAAVGLPIALAGTLGFAVAGADAQLPPWSLGYVYLPAVLGVVPTSTLLAPLGARLAHRLPTAMLRRSFAAFLTLVGAKMLLGA